MILIKDIIQLADLLQQIGCDFMTVHDSGLAIPKGIDCRTGLQVTPDDAVKSHRYLCIYCHEPVDLRKGAIRTAYFAHQKKAARTPLQKLCPGYHGEGSISSDIDSIEAAYILNGGIPVYLCEIRPECYELRADFRDISENAWNVVNAFHVKAVIIEGHEHHRLSLDTHPYYVINQLSNDWSEVELQHVKDLYDDCRYKAVVDEINRKWHWGIQGIQPDRTFFRSGPQGGRRIAENSNIVVNRKYLVIHSCNRRMPKIAGISFKYKGKLNIRYGAYCIREFIVREATDAARQYIGEKGYQLVEKRDSIVPLWPPASIKGRRLCYSSKQRIYLYRKGRNGQTVQWFGDLSQKRKTLIPENNVYTAYPGQSIVISNPDFNKLSGEIQYDLEFVESDFSKESIELSASCTNDKGTMLPIDDIRSLSFDDIPIDFFSSVPMVHFLAMRNQLVLYRFSGTLTSLLGMDSIQILLGIYEQKLIQITGFHKPQQNDVKDLNKICEALFRCNHAVTVGMVDSYRDILDYAERNDQRLYQMLWQWKRRKRMPYPAKKLLVEIREVLEHDKQSR